MREDASASDGLVLDLTRLPVKEHYGFEVRAMPVEMKLSRIIISEINEQQVIYLKEVDGSRQFPILIGIFEATSIDRRVKAERPRALDP